MNSNKEPNKYQEFIKTNPRLQRILNSIPDGLNKKEKAYFVYIELGKILKEDPRYVFNSGAPKDEAYGAMIDEDFYGICKSMSELYGEMLRDPRIGIDSTLVKNTPNRSGSHVELVLHIDGENILCNLIHDLANIKTGKKIRSFGYDPVKSIENRKKRFLGRLGISAEEKEKLSELLDRTHIPIERLTDEKTPNEFMEEIMQENSDFRNLTEIAKAHPEIPGMTREMIGILLTSQTNDRILQQIGKLKVVSEEELTQMDKKLGYSYSKEFDVSYYTNDTLAMLEEEMQDPEKVKRYIYEGKDVPEAEQLDYKLKYLFKNLDKIMPSNGEQGYFEYNTTLLRMGRTLLSPEEMRRIQLYGLQVGDKQDDVIPLVRVKSAADEYEDTFYKLNPESRKFESFSKSGIKEFFRSNGVNKTKVLGMQRNFDPNKAKKELDIDFDE